MQTTLKSQLPNIVSKYEKELLKDWMDSQLSAATLRPDLISASELQKQSSDFLLLLCQAIQAGNLWDISGHVWEPVRTMLTKLSASRARRGFRPSETAAFIFSFKRPLFDRLEQEIKDRHTLLNEIWLATVLLDKLGLHTTEAFQKTREEVIMHERERAEQQVHELEGSKGELQQQVHDLELLEQAVVGRELKLIALEKELTKLKAEKNKP